jgi:ribonuclease E/ribonuclease G
MTGGAPDLLVDRAGPLLRAVLAAPGGGPRRLLDLAVDRDGRAPRAGAVLRARVLRIDRAMEAAFLDVGAGEPGLLQLADVRPRGTRLSGGEALLVQVRAEARAGKGPLLTMDVSLPGRFLVRAPSVDGVSVSRRIGDRAARARAAARVGALAPGGGWIARAGAEDAPDGLVALEADALAARWRDLAARGDAPPALLDPGPSAPVRLLSELGGRPVGAVVVGDPAAERVLRAWAEGAAPDLADRIVASGGPPGPIEAADLEDEIAALSSPVAPLSAGGSLVIERTEAMWVVDVNAGGIRNALAANLEAAAETARQIRLRNAGGVVVVDTVSLDRPEDRQRVLDAFAAAVADDPAGTHVYGMSRLGLVEMTRTRRGPDLIDLLAGLPGG